MDFVFQIVGTMLCLAFANNNSTLRIKIMRLITKFVIFINEPTTNLMLFSVCF